MNQLGLWRLLAGVRGRKEPLVNWRFLLEGDFDVARPFLRECVGEFARSMRDPESGQVMLLRTIRGRRMAYTDPEFEGEYHQVWDVSDSEVQLWRLDAGALAAALGAAIGVEPRSAPGGGGNVGGGRPAGRPYWMWGFAGGAAAGGG